MIWDDLFEYVSNKINFHQVDGKWTWTCDGTLKLAEEFIDAGSFDKEAIIEKLKNTGGYCDCEILFNSVERIDGEIPLPQSLTSTVREVEE